MHTGSYQIMDDLPGDVRERVTPYNFQAREGVWGWGVIRLNAKLKNRVPSAFSYLFKLI